MSHSIASQLAVPRLRAGLHEVLGERLRDRVEVLALFVHVRELLHPDLVLGAARALEKDFVAAALTSACSVPSASTRRARRASSPCPSPFAHSCTSNRSVPPASSKRASPPFASTFANSRAAISTATPSPHHPPEWPAGPR
ncbi:unnamed protein product [Prorocentrum cordatum]|uniref:Uncharacterized protein n=1 Tax=Prorocentrum cordatum TaxID=2364126 RepID=A0ABN9THD4_9DINO|nr:unnamed protein product [Polarella glacialis]